MREGKDDVIYATMVCRIGESSSPFPEVIPYQNKTETLEINTKALALRQVHGSL